MASQTTVNGQITDAITTRQAQITQLQAEVNALQQAASLLSSAAQDPGPVVSFDEADALFGKRTTVRRTRAARKAPPQPKPTQKRSPWGAAAKQAMSKRMKALGVRTGSPRHRDRTSVTTLLRAGAAGVVRTA